jgi:hypothetical protein
MNVTLTINLPGEDWDEERDVESLDGLLEDLKREYPELESVVLAFSLPEIEEEMRYPNQDSVFEDYGIEADCEDFRSRMIEDA